MNRPIYRCTAIPRPVLRRYEQYLRLEKSFSDNTLDAYERDLLRFDQYLSDEGIDFRAPTLQQLDQFAATLLDSGISHKTIARVLAGVRSFYHFLFVEKEIKQDPTELLASPSRGLYLPQVLSLDEIDQILQSIDQSKDEGIRDHVT
jgi:integrase/recombinase XerD